MPGRVDPERVRWITNWRYIQQRNTGVSPTYSQARRAYDRAHAETPLVPLTCFHTSRPIEIGDLYVAHHSYTGMRTDGGGEQYIIRPYRYATYLDLGGTVRGLNIARMCGSRVAGHYPVPYQMDHRVDPSALGSEATPVIMPYEDTPESSYDEDDYTDYSDDYEEDNEDIEPEYRYSEDVEIYSDDAPPRMTLPEIEGRPSRMLSVEQEVIRGGRWCAIALNEAGLASPERHGYSTTNSNYFAFVKSDGSVDSEIVYGRMRLDDHDIAAKFQQGLEIVRTGIAESNVALSERCGLHIHVDIHKWTMRQLTSLYHLWNYLEQPIFRIAAAHWRGGHRSLMGNRYSPESIKGHTTHSAIGSALRGVRGALNLQNFMESRHNCSCGSTTFGVWDECTCNPFDLGKTTAEFRVFNTTANLKKMRAYTALCLALVGYAENHSCTPEDFPTFSWNEGRGDISTIQNAAQFSEEMMKRLQFILTELPFTDEEKEDVFYCIKHSIGTSDKVEGWETLNPAQQVIAA